MCACAHRSDKSHADTYHDINLSLAMPGSDQGSFVTDVCDIRSRESRRKRGHALGNLLDVVGKSEVLKVNLRTWIDTQRFVRHV
jgi:hypothetical protein